MTVICVAALGLSAVLGVCLCAVTVLLYNSHKEANRAFNATHRVMLASILAKQSGDPRITAAAVHHLTMRPPPVDPIDESEGGPGGGSLSEGSVEVEGTLV